MKNIHLNCSWIKLSYIKKMSATFKNISFKKASFIFHLLEKNYKIRPKWHISLCESLWFYLSPTITVYSLFSWWSIICAFSRPLSRRKITIHRTMPVAVAIIGFLYWKQLKLLIFYMWKKPSINDYWSIVWLFLHTPVI